MILQKIKLSGFKSFVDPTSVPFPSYLVGVVGPNGCGKSNVIDAVRWVMGEGAPSRLRGGSATDMIFSGSSQRQPAGQASVELVFENTGETHSTHTSLAAYSEIAIRREVTRDGQSTYFLNNTRCRRKDIADIFLGTGLGPRSYSIIQQGTVSQLIEAKPEEMRQFLEEAAGISKYKERRKETNTRIRHTRENLERLNDVRSELEQQLSHLQRQANAAEKYKQLKQDQRKAISELHALKWQNLDQKLTQAKSGISGQETALQASIAKIRATEADTEQLKRQHTEAVDKFSFIQAEYYQIGGEIGRIEQTVQHHKERKQQLSFDFDKAQSHWQELRQTIDQDQQAIEQLAEQITELTPAYEQATELAQEQSQILAQAEADLAEWRKNWDEFTELASTSSKKAEVEQANIRQLEERLLGIKNKLERTLQELASIDSTPVLNKITELTEQLEQAKQTEQASLDEMAHTREAITEKQQLIQQLAASSDQLKHQLQSHQGRLASLEALQEAALGHKDQQTQSWLEHEALTQATRLAQNITVEAGWEKAVEVVLGDYLQAVAVASSDFKSKAEALTALSAGHLTLIDQHDPQQQDNYFSPNSLLAKITSQQPLGQFVNVLTAESLADAWTMVNRADFKPYQSVVTKDGIWLAKHWIRVARDKDHQSGVIARERELTELNTLIEQQGAELSAIEEQYAQNQELLTQYQSKLDALVEQNQQQQRQSSRLEADLKIKQGQLEQAERREQRLKQEIQEQQHDQEGLSETLAVARESWHEALSHLEQYDEQREQLNQQKAEVHQTVEQARTAANTHKQTAHQLEIQLQAANTKHQSLLQNSSRLNQQFTNLSERKAQLASSLSDSENPMEDLTEQLEELLAKRVGAEAELQAARDAKNALEEQLTKLDKTKYQHEEAVNTIRAGMESEKLAIEGLKVRQQTIVEQLAEMDLVVETILAELEQAEASQSIEQLEEYLAQLDRRIQRLGAINLAAIDELKEKSERKEYLDQQNNDLEAALATLESAMQKIDKETRVKFKETYDTVNNSFKLLFPKIFGGGSASLELTGTDLLDTGIEVIARPPGKKNATIHLLSGGEKTMTAIALVFSIFQLNPSPFCMLDEVDAPLDDANVVRFCELVKEMSSKVQFVVITHNKVTMEMMHQLMGVTMHEPGVSRIVSVDVAQAAEMVEEG